MAPRQSRGAWLAVHDEETARPAKVDAAAPAPARRLQAAVLVASGLALVLLGLAVWPHWGSQLPAADASDLTGLAEQASPQSGKGWWLVARPAILREGMSLDTPKVAVLRAGEHVLVTEVKGHRAHIQAPHDGWVSTETATGVPIIASLGLLGPAGAPPGLRPGEGAEALQKMSGAEVQARMSSILAQTNKVLEEAGGRHGAPVKRDMRTDFARGAEGLTEAEQMLRKDGQTLADATKGLTTDPKLQALMDQIMQQPGLLAQAPATSARTA